MKIIIYFAVLCLFFPLGFDLSFQEMTITQAISIVLFPFCVISLARSKILTLGGEAGERVFRAGFLVLLVILLSLYNADYFIDVIRYSSRYIFGLLLAVSIIIYINDKTSLIMFDRFFIFGCAVIVLVCISSFFIESLNDLVTHRSGRYQGFFRHPNSYAIALSCSLPIVLTKYQTSFGKERLLYLLALFLHLVAIVLTGSKFNLFIAIIVFLYVFQINRGVNFSLSRLFIGVLFSSLLSMLMVSAFIYYLQNFNSALYDKFTSLMNDPFEQETVTDRLEIWEAGVSHSNVFLGYGAGHVPHYFEFSHLHNTFIDFYFSMGGFGLLALLYFYYSLFHLYVHVRGRELGAAKSLMVAYSLLPLIYILSNQMSGSMGTATIIVLWAVIGRIISGINLANTNEA